MALEAIDILGVHVHCTDTTRMLDTVANWVGLPAKRTILYVNAHCMNTAHDDHSYRDLLNAADLVYADGVSVAWASRWLGGCQMQKATGADWIEPFCALAAPRRWKLYILAGQPGVATAAQARLAARYPGLQVVGTSDGYFRERTEAQVIQHITAVAPDVIFVGFGTPLQEKWLAAHLEVLPVGVYWAVGALFDYVAGIERRAPAWMLAFGLEWAWRLLLNPVGKARRYLLGNPVFVARVLREHRKRIKRN